jgi:hypothetical protein
MRRGRSTPRTLCVNKKDSNPAKWDLPLCGELGFIWEDILSYFFGNRYTARIPEVERDGLICSPDAIGPDPWGEVPLVDEEYKLTWTSSNKDIEDNWYYMTQFKTYAYALNVPVTIVRIIHIMGDYSWRGQQLVEDGYRVGPVRKTYRMEWEKDELEENWNMILTNRDKMLILGLMEFDEPTMKELKRQGKI